MYRIKKTFVLGALAFGMAGTFALNGRAEDLSKEAKISEPDARKIALARVPGDVRSEELEREHHRLIYSYDIKQANKTGVEEVQVDAKTGKVVSVMHESAAKEKKEEHGNKQ